MWYVINPPKILSDRRYHINGHTPLSLSLLLLLHHIFHPSRTNTDNKQQIETHVIMASEMQNENPTILSAADLPTRQRNKPAHLNNPHHQEYEGTVFFKDLALPELTDPFTTLPTSYVSEESETEDDDENTLEEPIDEQEIYGEIS